MSQKQQTQAEQKVKAPDSGNSFRVYWEVETH